MSKYTRYRRPIRGALVASAVVAISLVAAIPALATPFTSDLLITAEFDVFVETDEPASLEGVFAAIEAGVGTSTFFADLLAGDGALIGDATFTDFGDGVAFSGDGVASAFEDPLGELIEGLYFAGIGVFFAIENTSATETYKVTFDADFFHFVDADGEDAFATSFFVVEGPVATEVLSDIGSDTLVGDFKNGTDLPTAGALVDDFGLSFFDVIVAPSTIEFVDVFAFFDGEALSADGFASGAFAHSVTIGDVMVVVPEPSVVLLFGAGLVALGATRRRRVG